MSEEDYKAVIASYQQKAFELFNANIVLETQINTLKTEINILNQEIEKYRSSKQRKTTKEDAGEF